MKSKKLLAFLMAAVMVAGVLSGCGGSKTEAPADTAPADNAGAEAPADTEIA